MGHGSRRGALARALAARAARARDELRAKAAEHPGAKPDGGDDDDEFEERRTVCIRDVFREVEGLHRLVAAEYPELERELSADDAKRLAGGAWLEDLDVAGKKRGIVVGGGRTPFEVQAGAFRAAMAAACRSMWNGIIEAGRRSKDAGTITRACEVLPLVAGRMSDLYTFMPEFQCHSVPGDDDMEDFRRAIFPAVTRFMYVDDVVRPGPGEMVALINRAVMLASRFMSGFQVPRPQLDMAVSVAVPLCRLFDGRDGTEREDMARARAHCFVHTYALQPEWSWACMKVTLMLNTNATALRRRTGGGAR